MTEKQKPIRLADGMTLRNGQLIRKTNVARDGAEKRPHVAEPAFGMRNREAEHMPGLAQNFSNPLDDEPNTIGKPFLDGRSAPPVVAHRSRTRPYDRDEGTAVLNDSVLSVGKK
jgi:hypothetical protein